MRTLALLAVLLPVAIHSSRLAVAADPAQPTAQVADSPTPLTPGQPQPAPQPGLTDDDIRLMSEAEIIEVWDERPDKPFDRDTSLRLTGEELARRGATDLGSALALLPDVSVRAVGRGGVNIDIRGARKGSVRVLIDGVSVSDPFYGTFDVSTIPITDIVQIRVSTTPLSPIDGPGGPGGVIEVHTRDAVGTQLVLARIGADTLPSATLVGSARAMLSERWAVRLSASGNAGVREFSLPPSATNDVRNVAEGRRAATLAVRFEYRDGDPTETLTEGRLARRTTRRLVLDLFADDRRYLTPPSETRAGSLLLIDRETTLRAGLGLDQKTKVAQLLGRAWVHQLRRISRNFRDVRFTDQAQLENLSAWRVGAQAMATRAFGKQRRVALATVFDHERAVAVDGQAMRTAGAATVLEVAANGQIQTVTTKLDAAVGVAVPFGIGAGPWLEGKVVGRWQATAQLELIATVARKGRTPTLRERYDRTIGNAALGPELATIGELRLVATPWRLRLEAAPYIRRSIGTTRVGPVTGQLENIGNLQVVGVDVLASVHVRSGYPRIRLGGAYTPVRATSDASGDADALDRLPRHRGEAWVEFDPAAAWSLRPRLRSYGQSLDQGATVPGATLLDATVAYTSRDATQFTLRFDDVLNARPEIRNGFFSPGRTLMAAVTVQW